LGVFCQESKLMLTKEVAGDSNEPFWTGMDSAHEGLVPAAKAEIAATIEIKRQRIGRS
jgi:hypothetical protein